MFYLNSEDPSIHLGVNSNIFQFKIFNIQYLITSVLKIQIIYNTHAMRTE